MKKRIVSLLLALCLLAGLACRDTAGGRRHQHRHRHQSENVYLARQGRHIRLQERERV